MPISNMQQARQMYEYGGLSAPRQNYGLGSFVKKAVRGVKKVVKSPLGKASSYRWCRIRLGGGILVHEGIKGLVLGRFRIEGRNEWLVNFLETRVAGRYKRWSR
jgi:hypothetical protein